MVDTASPTPVPSNVGHTPISIKASSTSTFQGFPDGGTTKNDQTQAKRRKLDSEMDWAFLSVDKWLKTCLPGPDPAGLSFKPFEVDLKHQEVQMYPGLVRFWSASCLPDGC